MKKKIIFPLYFYSLIFSILIYYLDIKEGLNFYFHLLNLSIYWGLIYTLQWYDKTVYEYMEEILKGENE